MFAYNQQLLTVAIVTTLVVSLVAFTGTSAAVHTTVTGPSEVERPETVELHSTLTIDDGERVPVENFTLTVHPAGSPDESVRVTFAPDGTIQRVTPEGGVAGQGEIRIAQLRDSLSITLAERTAGVGYGYGYGYDERHGDEPVSLGYGYGSEAGDFTYDVSFDSKALKHGSYEVSLAVNTPSKTGLFRSNVASFDVTVPSGVSPPDRGEGKDASGAAPGNGAAVGAADDDTERDERGGRDSPPRRGRDG